MEEEGKWYHTQPDAKIAHIISNASLKAAVELQKEVFPKRQSDSRSCLVSLALEEIEKGHLIVLEMLEYLGEDPTNWKPEDSVPMLRKHMMNLLTERLLLLIRKLAEVLIDLINFSDTDTDAAIAAYFLVEHIDYLFRELKNCDDFFGIKPRVIEEKIKSDAKKLQLLIDTIPETKRWFINMNNFRDGKPKAFLSKPMPQKQVYALNLADASEKVRIGGSYDNVLSRCDAAAHFSAANETRYEYSGRDLMVHLVQLSFLEYSVLARCEKLLGKSPSQTTKDMESLLAKTNQETVFHGSYVGNLSVGDTVTTRFGHTGIIKEIITGKNGYAILRIQYSGKENNTEDWMPVRYIISS